MALKNINNLSCYVYNLGNGKGFSVREVINTTKKITKKEIPAVIVARRKGDPAELLASSSKIKRELNWEPKYPNLKEIVLSDWKWQQRYPMGYLANRLK